MADTPARKVRQSTDAPKAAGNRGKGRVKGVPNKATAELKELAREYTAEALAALVGVMRDGSDTAKVSAVKELFDRGFGKASQAVDLKALVEFVGLDVAIKR